MKTLKNARIITAAMVAVLGIAVGFLFEKMFEIDVKIEISIGLLILIAVVVVAVLTWTVFTFLIKLYEEREKNEELENLIKLKNEESTGTKMNKMLAMAMAQELSEPIRIKLLKEVQGKDVISTLILANMYFSGLKNGERVIVAKDYDEAYRLYNSVCKIDTSGVAYWMMGWMCEKNKIKATKKLGEEECKKMAVEFYEKSSECGFPKGKNSLGKFYWYGWGGYSQDASKAIAYYSQAADGGDIYAILNCGHCEMNFYKKSLADGTADKSHLQKAREYFEKAAEHDNIEGFLHLGIAFENLEENENAKEYYIKAINAGNNVYTATAYYKLGLLLKKIPQMEKDAKVLEALNLSVEDNTVIECFKKAYDVFLSLNKKGMEITGKFYKDCYANLITVFKSVE